MIDGLTYIENWLYCGSESLIEMINNSFWQTSLKRRVQQYGPVYNYSRTRILDPELFSIPDWLEELASRLVQENLFETKPNQIIINEYLPGQGISKHIDSPLFGPTIASLSLLSDTNMKLGKYNQNEKEICLKKNSLLVLTKEARTDWYHSIPNVKEKRISITFRTIQ